MVQVEVYFVNQFGISVISEHLFYIILDKYKHISSLENNSKWVFGIENKKTNTYCRWYFNLSRLKKGNAIFLLSFVQL